MTDDNQFSNANYVMTVEDEGEGYQVPYNNGNPVTFGFESITAAGSTKAYVAGEVSQVRAGDADYFVRYFVDGDNGAVNDKSAYGTFDAWDVQVGDGRTAPTEVGSYFAVAITASALEKWSDRHPGESIYDNAEGLVSMAGARTPGIIVVPFEVTPWSLEDAVAVNGADGSDSFTYTSKAQDVEVYIGSKPLDYDEDYTVTVLQEGVGTVDFRTGIINAGTYTLTISGQANSPYAGESVTRTITVDPLNLSEATYYAADYKAGRAISGTGITGPADLIYVNGDDVTVRDLLDAKAVAFNQTAYDLGGITYGQDESGFVSFYQRCMQDSAVKGGYAFNLEPVAGNANVVAGARGTAKINVVEKLISDFRYGDHLTQGIATEIGGLDEKFDLSKGESYDGSTIVAVEDDTEMIAQGTAAGQVTVDPLTAAEPGTYGVTARVNVDEHYTLGGSVRDEFTVVGGYLDPADVDVTVLFNGVNFDITKVQPYTQQYTGEAVVPVISVSCNGSVLAAGEDYTVTYFNGQDQAVDSMVDAGEYTVVIELANGYVFTSGASTVAKFGVKITPRELTGISVVEPVKDADGDYGILYTGSAITPSIKGTYKGNDDGDRTITLDPSWYELHGLSMKSGEFYSPVDQVLEVGAYKVNVVPSNGTLNYTWDYEAAVDFEVIATAAYADVAADAWYADEVAKASALKYVRGMGDNLFFPNADMTRAQFAQVLYNMAGEPSGWWEDTASNESGTYPTQFSDVVADAWYAKAVSWAVEAGVVNGVSDTEFEPEGKITREQIATMLYRYAGNGAQADLAVLDQFADAGSVSDWAETAMAWAVEEGHMNGRGGDGLQPQGNATRAEVAALSVRVQPEPLEKPIV